MKHLILDFDGTIVDSGALVFKTLLDYTNNSNFSWRELRDYPSDEVVSKLGISFIQLPKIILKVRSDFKEKLNDLPIVEGIVETLKELKSMNINLHVVSSNSEDNIRDYLEMNQIGDLFTSITSFFTIFGKDSGISKLLSQSNISNEDAIYVGDETRDIQAARKAKIKCLAVTWGYNSEKILKEYSPDYLANSPKDLMKIICEDIR